jgi:hypothetical protein
MEVVAAVDRAIKVLAAINEVARAEGVPIAVRHVCGVRRSADGQRGGLVRDSRPGFV